MRKATEPFYLFASVHLSDDIDAKLPPGIDVREFKFEVI
jgi:hypothetical protein